MGKGACAYLGAERRNNDCGSKDNAHRGEVEGQAAPGKKRNTGTAQGPAKMPHANCAKFEQERPDQGNDDAYDDRAPKRENDTASKCQNARNAAYDPMCAINSNKNGKSRCREHES